MLGDHGDALGDYFGCAQQILSNLHYNLHIRRLFLLRYQRGIIYQIQHLMKEALSRRHRHLSTHFNINWIIRLPRQHRSLYINNSNCFNIVFVFALLDDVDEIFGLARLADHDDGLVLGDVGGLEVDGVIEGDLLETV